MSLKFIDLSNTTNMVLFKPTNSPCTMEGYVVNRIKWKFNAFKTSIQKLKRIFKTLKNKTNKEQEEEKKNLTKKDGIISSKIQVKTSPKTLDRLEMEKQNPKCRENRLKNQEIECQSNCMKGKLINSHVINRCKLGL